MFRETNFLIPSFWFRDNYQKGANSNCVSSVMTFTEKKANN